MPQLHKALFVVSHFFGSHLIQSGQNFSLNLRKQVTMRIERTKKEVIIRLPATVDTEDLQDFLDYARYKELTSKFSVSQVQADQLADQVNKSWWTKNRKRFIK